MTKDEIELVHLVTPDCGLAKKVLERPGVSWWSGLFQAFDEVCSGYNLLTCKIFPKPNVVCWLSCPAPPGTGILVDD